MHFIPRLSAGYVSRRCFSLWKKRADEIWEKDAALDKVVRWESSINVVRKVMKVLDSKDGPIMSMYELSKSRTNREKKLLIQQIVVKFPQIFKFQQDKEGEFWVDFTPEAAEIVKQEKLDIQRHDELASVNLLRKLLMMAKDHRIGLEKLGHLKHEFMFPEKFKQRLLPQHPEFFKVVNLPKSPGQGYVELVGWDGSLAVTARESTAIAAKPHAFQVDGRVRLINHAAVQRFQKLQFLSPYEDPGRLDYRTLEAEKRAVAVLHEFLSLMPMKKAVLGRAVLLQEELQLPKGFVDLAEVYNWIFYVSRVIPKNKTIFVRDGFCKSELKVPNYLSTARERVKQLMKNTYHSGPNSPPKPKLEVADEDLEDITDFFVSYVGPLRNM